MKIRAIVGGFLAMLAVPILAQAPDSPAPLAAKRPASDFAQLPFMSDPQLSPDGRSVAAKVAIDGRQVLMVRPLFEKDKEPVLIGLGENELRSWTWVNDQWLVLEIGAVKSVEGEPFYMTRIAGVSADGKTLNPIAFREGGQNARAIWIAHDGTPRVLMSMQKSIYVGNDFWPTVSEVDVSTGRVRTQVAGTTGVMNWFADPSGAVRMGIGYNDGSRSSRLLYRPTVRDAFRAIDRASARANDSLTIPFLTTDPAAPS